MIVVESGIVNDDNAVHDLNDESPRFVTPLGMIILVSP